MKERKNIDRLFQEKFKDFEMHPDEQVWKNIEAALQKKKKRRVIPIWWYRTAGVAALLLIGLFTWNSLYDSPASPIGPTNDVRNGGSTVVDVPAPEEETGTATTTKSPSSEGSTTATPTGGRSSGADPKKATRTSGDITSGTPTAVASETEHPGTTAKKTRGVRHSTSGTPLSKTRKATENSQIATHQRSSATEQRRQILEGRHNGTGRHATDGKTASGTLNEGVASNGENRRTNASGTTPDTPSANDRTIPAPKSDKTTESIAATTTPEDPAKVAADTQKLQELLQQQNEKEVADATTRMDRWQVTTNVAPVYLGSASKSGSAIDPQFNSNSKSYNSSTSYGVGVSYAINKRLSVRAGLNKLDMAYDTNDVVFFASIGKPSLQALDANSAGIQVMNPAVANLGLESFELDIRQENTGAIRQEMGYYEVPVELAYKLIDSKFSVSVIGGFSTLLLNENRISVLSPTLSTSIGQANNLNEVHYSGNFGLGLRYRFLKSLELHCEPTLKYQMNTFSGNDGNFKPYIFGIYSGLSLSF